MSIYHQDDFSGRETQKMVTHTNFSNSLGESSGENKETLSDEGTIPIVRLLKSNDFALLWEAGIQEEGWIKNGVVTA